MAISVIYSSVNHVLQHVRVPDATPSATQDVIPNVIPQAFPNTPSSALAFLNTPRAFPDTDTTTDVTPVLASEVLAAACAWMLQHVSNNVSNRVSHVSNVSTVNVSTPSVLPARTSPSRHAPGGSLPPAPEECRARPLHPNSTVSNVSNVSNTVSSNVSNVPLTDAPAALCAHLATCFPSLNESSNDSESYRAYLAAGASRAGMGGHEDRNAPSYNESYSAPRDGSVLARLRKVMEGNMREGSPVYMMMEQRLKDALLQRQASPTLNRKP